MSAPRKSAMSCGSGPPGWPLGCARTRYQEWRDQSGGPAAGDAPRRRCGTGGPTTFSGRLRRGGARPQTDVIVAYIDENRERVVEACANLAGESTVTTPDTAMRHVLGSLARRWMLLHGGNRQANAGLYRAVIVQVRWHQPTID